MVVNFGDFVTDTGADLTHRYAESGEKEKEAMSRNMGGLDRGVRVVIGVGLIALALTGPQSPWGWIGLVPLATALIGWCPLYRVLGIRTCRAS